jgi:hypothetical protein
MNSWSRSINSCNYPLSAWLPEPSTTPTVKERSAGRRLQWRPAIPLRRCPFMIDWVDWERQAVPERSRTPAEAGRPARDGWTRRSPGAYPWWPPSAVSTDNRRHWPGGGDTARHPAAPCGTDSHRWRSEGRRFDPAPGHRVQQGLACSFACALVPPLGSCGAHVVAGAAGALDRPAVRVAPQPACHPVTGRRRTRPGLRRRWSRCAGRSSGPGSSTGGCGRVGRLRRGRTGR